MKPLRNVTTDFCGDGAFQKCVRFSADGSIIATGGADGHLRVWKVVAMLYLSSYVNIKVWVTFY